MLPRVWGPLDEMGRSLGATHLYMVTLIYVHIQAYVHMYDMYVHHKSFLTINSACMQSWLALRHVRLHP